MTYLTLVLLLISLVAIGVINYQNTCRSARKLLELLKNE